MLESDFPRGALSPRKRGSLREDENVMSSVKEFGHSEESVQRMGQLDLRAAGEGRLPGGGGF